MSSEFRSLSTLEAAAADRALPEIWAYVQGGAAEERTVRLNLDAFRRRVLRPRVLRGISSLDLGTRLLGRSVRVPWYVAPMAYQGDLHPDGELATARSAAEAGVLACFSTLSSRSLEEIAAVEPQGPRWFQLYLQPEFAESERLVRRAESAGFAAIALTADAPVFGIRDRQRSVGFAIDAARPLGNGPHVVPPARAPLLSGDRWIVRPDGAADWAVIDRLRAVTRLPILVKGIVRGDDAREALRHGAAGVIVSNHGGRQLDGGVASLEALPEVVRAVEGEGEVFLDGGVRRGSDVAMAMALGAAGVGIGRPVLWALLLGGAPALTRYFDLLREEFTNVLLLLGCASVADLRPDIVR